MVVFLNYGPGSASWRGNRNFWGIRMGGTDFYEWRKSEKKEKNGPPYDLPKIFWSPPVTGTGTPPHTHKQTVKMIDP